MRLLTTILLLLALALIVTACGTMAPPPSPKPQMPRAGKWTQAYSGECAERESETLRITQLDEMGIVFDDFKLLRNEAGEYVGSVVYIAPMPVDGREIPYEIGYRLRASDGGGFIGSESIVEGGGQGHRLPD